MTARAAGLSYTAEHLNGHPTRSRQRRDGGKEVLIDFLPKREVKPFEGLDALRVSELPIGALRAVELLLGFLLPKRGAAPKMVI